MLPKSEKVFVASTLTFPRILKAVNVDGSTKESLLHAFKCTNGQKLPKQELLLLPCCLRCVLLLVVKVSLQGR